MSLTASRVSRLLRQGGLNPLGSGTSRMREGVRVTQSLGQVTVGVSIDSPNQEGRVVQDVKDILTEAGLAFEVYGDRNNLFDVVA